MSDTDEKILLQLITCCVGLVFTSDAPAASAGWRRRPSFWAAAAMRSHLHIPHIPPHAQAMAPLGPPILVLPQHQKCPLHASNANCRSPACPSAIPLHIACVPCSGGCGCWAPSRPRPYWSSRTAVGFLDVLSERRVRTGVGRSMRPSTPHFGSPGGVSGSSRAGLALAANTASSERPCTPHPALLVIGVEASPNVSR